jgi:GT2 family glycosyltransferase
MTSVHVSVIIGTSGRPDTLPDAVDSVLANAFPSFEVVVVDQSRDDRSEAALRPRLEDRRLRYMRSATRGVSVARNIAIGASTGEYVLVTDDDTRVSPDWIETHVAAFNHRPNVAIIFGSLVAGFDPTPGAIPTFVPERTMVVRARHPVTTGFGANMGIRRSALSYTGLFDEQIGPGAPLRLTEEVDLGWRAIRAGFDVLLYKESQVLHFGYRPPGEVADLTRRNAYGTAALLVKQFRCGEREALVDMLRFHGAYVSGVVRAVARRRGPFHLRSLRIELAAFLSGAYAALQFPLDRERGVYLPQSWTTGDPSPVAKPA